MIRRKKRLSCYLLDILTNLEALEQKVTVVISLLTNNIADLLIPLHYIHIYHEFDAGTNAQKVEMIWINSIFLHIS